MLWVKSMSSGVISLTTPFQFLPYPSYVEVLTITPFYGVKKRLNSKYRGAGGGVIGKSPIPIWIKDFGIPWGLVGVKLSHFNANDLWLKWHLLPL